MKYQEIVPQLSLKPYIKCYYLFESDSDKDFEDIVFPSGLMEMIFNLGNGTWETYSNNQFHVTPKIELWGQLNKPLPIRSTGKHSMLGVKFYPHTAACFLKEEIGVFNNQVIDLSEVMDRSVRDLHHQLLETSELNARIQLIENFFLRKLPVHPNDELRLTKVGQLLANMRRNSSDDNINEVAFRHGITPRYLHKLISQYTGLSPKLFYKISRFQESLKMIAHKDASLTSVAYECGYFDQSHFIKDFKSFTGLTPSAYQENKSGVNELLLA